MLIVLSMEARAEVRVWVGKAAEDVVLVLLLVLVLAARIACIEQSLKSHVLSIKFLKSFIEVGELEDWKLSL